MKQLLHVCSVCEQGVSPSASRCPHCGEDYSKPASTGVVLNPAHPDYKSTYEELVRQNLEAIRERKKRQAADSLRGTIWAVILCLFFVALAILYLLKL